MEPFPAPAPPRSSDAGRSLQASPDTESGRDAHQDSWCNALAVSGVIEELGVDELGAEMRRVVVEVDCRDLGKAVEEVRQLLLAHLELSRANL